MGVCEWEEEGEKDHWRPGPPRVKLQPWTKSWGRGSPHFLDNTHPEGNFSQRELGVCVCGGVVVVMGADYSSNLTDPLTVLIEI